MFGAATSGPQKFTGDNTNSIMSAVGTSTNGNGEIKNRERILEAIDQLRRRKARPNIHRITTYLFRRFSVPASETKEDLQMCVDRDIVFEVQYKGSLSYRNALKKSLLKRDSSHGISSKANRKFAQLLTSAISQLMLQEPDYTLVGVPAESIIHNILAQDSVRYNSNYIKILLEKEVQSGFITKLPNGQYLMGSLKQENAKIVGTTTSPTTARHHLESDVPEPQQPKPNSPPATPIAASIPKQQYSSVRIHSVTHIKPKKKSSSVEVPVDTSPSPTKVHRTDDEHMQMGSKRKKTSDSSSLRVGGRRKRAKKVFDPSDTHVPKKRGRPAGSLNKTTIEKQMARLSDESRPNSRASNPGREHGGVCSVCHVQSKRGPNDRMVACRECSNKAHYSCLNGDDMMLRTYPDNTWQCPHCKTCVVCFETSDAGNLIVCSVCADAYHTGCIPSDTSEKLEPNVKWLCANCEAPEELEFNEIQANIAAASSFSRRSNIDNSDNYSSPSRSGKSTPDYQSPPSSPPQLIPQNEVNQNEDPMSDSQSSKDSSEDNIDPSIPDASTWSYEEVYQYFYKYFPREAHIFREEEIDGRSLLLLTRIDVLTNLKLKLGPALKIYKHIVKLQLRRDDPKYYWL